MKIISFLKKVASSFRNKKEVATFFGYKPDVGDVRAYCEDWNINFPLDRWWRIKHKIPFGSKAHLEANFIDMLIEFEEDKIFLEIEKSKFERDTANNPELKSEEEQFEDFMEECKGLDLSKFDD